jgi:NAD(P)-dependent dehydrogenase (short-subunit alcohol dehydrogenase family)
LTVADLALTSDCTAPHRRSLAKQSHSIDTGCTLRNFSHVSPRPAEVPHGPRVTGYDTPMRILIVGATGTIGQAVAAELGSTHELVRASYSKAPLRVDIGDPASIRALYSAVGMLDAVISIAGPARFKPFTQLTDDDYSFTLTHKLMGQVNLVRLGMDSVTDGGAFILTSGVLSTKPMPGSGVISLANAGLEGFTRAAALEAPRGIRLNIVSPPWVTETLQALGMPLADALPAREVAKTYARVLSDQGTGRVVVP